MSVLSLIYRPLCHEMREIQLLCIEQYTDLDDDIHCTLEIVSLDAHPYYVALSYEWGELVSESNATRVFINSVEKECTANLRDTLKHLRGMEWEGKFWTDAICIN
jgi:hypothetical protein